MREAFFTARPSKSPRGSELPKCGFCGLAKQCESPKMKYKGLGRKQILLVGEAPGAEEDAQNEQFVGKAGKRLEHELSRFAIKMNRDCWKTNAIRCRPPNNTLNPKKILSCQPILLKEIAELRPKIILLLGKTPATVLLSDWWNPKDGFELGKWMGWQIPVQKANCWTSVHYHPSYLERAHSDLVDVVFRKNLKDALSKKARPWPDGPPNYASKIEIEFDDRRAAKRLREIKDGTIAFDYETNALKPEYPGTEIFSCSVYWANRWTIAFPWSGPVLDEMRRILTSTKIQKVGTNIKFEDRWTKLKLGVRVKRWVWDTMLAAHILYQARGITGLKFQCFVLLGQERYDDHIRPYLEPVKGTYLNRITDIPLSDLLLYNGMDSRVCYEVAIRQRRCIKNAK